MHGWHHSAHHGAETAIVCVAGPRLLLPPVLQHVPLRRQGSASAGERRGGKPRRGPYAGQLARVPLLR